MLNLRIVAEGYRSFSSTSSLAKTAVNSFNLKFFVKFEIGASIEDLR
jgi:hypothetical protein